ncbi:MAG: dihydrodipicolinate synthase family protein, partial [Ferruginibacter sp.]
MSVREQLKGTGVAIVTPFTAINTIDFEALGNLLDYLIKGGVQYIVTMGTTGETPVLSKEEKKSIIQFTYAHVNGRLPVVVGVGGNCTQDVIDDLNYFPLQHATAV